VVVVGSVVAEECGSVRIVDDEFPGPVALAAQQILVAPVAKIGDCLRAAEVVRELASLL